jgi:hypothetical protein
MGGGVAVIVAVALWATRALCTPKRLQELFRIQCLNFVDVLGRMLFSFSV